MASNTSWYLGYMNEKLAAEAVAHHMEPPSESRGQPPGEVGDPLAQRVEKRPVVCDTSIPRSRRPIAVENDQTVDESSYSISSAGHYEESLSDSEKAEALAVRLQTQFQPVTDPSVLAVIDV